MEIAGLAVFSAIKYIGYFLYLKLACPSNHSGNIYFIALLRLLAGLAVGMSIYYLFNTGRDFVPVYISAIFVGRFVIWFAVFHIFYKSLSIKEKIKFTLGGVAVSYVLDIPSMAGLWVTIGGIC